MIPYHYVVGCRVCVTAVLQQVFHCNGVQSVNLFFVHMS